MEFKESQEDMNTAYYVGATGVLASGINWGIAGLAGSIFQIQRVW